MNHDDKHANDDKNAASNKNAASDKHVNSEHAPEYDPLPAKTSPDNTSSESTSPNRVVGIGASAGGLGALRRFFENMPEDTGMAFVVIQHLSPKHDSALPQILQESTTMPVTSVEEDRTTLRANHVYVISPDHSLGVEGGVLQLLERDRSSNVHSVIDMFFRALAKDMGDKAVGIVLSGTGSDGSQGLRELKEYGGITIVQAFADAEFEDMPRNASHLGLIDIQAPAAEMPHALINMTRREHHLPILQDAEDLTPDSELVLEDILKVLHENTGHDFAGYKRSTVVRRLGRRMNVHDLHDMPDYLRLVRESRPEREALFRELLISVTRFFRDSETFEHVAQEIIPKLFERKDAGQTVRVWVTGCATGEEAYSLAMLLHEHNRTLSAPRKVQIFASDIDKDALAIAREGVYPHAIETDVSRERLEYFFDPRGENDSYRVKEWVREMVLFSPHNLVSDPPFAHLDMVSCRNILIYFQSDLRSRVFATFHYALEPKGILLLGSAETAPKESFKPLDKHHHIFARSGENVPRRAPPQPDFRSQGQPHQRPTDNPQEAGASLDMQRLLLDHYLPPSVLVNEDYKVIYIVGKVGNYLEPPQGTPNYDVLEMAREGLQLGLRTALIRAFQQHQNTIDIILPIDTPAHKNDLTPKALPPADADTPAADAPENEHLEANTSQPAEPADSPPEQTPPEQKTGTPPAQPNTPLVRMSVRRVDRVQDNSKLALISFEQDVTPEVMSTAMNQHDAGLLLELERELHNTHASLRSTVREMEISNEELRASNEELRSLNEELQLVNEELTVSKEELQSTYEELTIVNQELQDKIVELGQANNDLNNFIANTNVATVFVDAQRRLKRYTPLATTLLNIIDVDVGRPFFHISHSLKDVDLSAVIDQVLTNAQPLEQKVQSQDNRWFIMQARPYRTTNDRTDGVVITWSDVTSLQREQSHLAALLDVFPDAIVRVDRSSKHLSVKPSPNVPSINETLVGRTYEETLRAEHVTVGHAQLRQAFETGKVVTERYIDPLGTPQVLEVRTIAINDNEAFQIVRDVTNDEVTSVLRKGKEQLELVLEGGELAFWDWQLPRGIRVVNDRWTMMFGYKTVEIARRLVEGWFPPIHPADQALREATLDAHFAGETPTIANEFRMKHKQGHWVWVRERGKVVERNSAGKPTRAVGVLIDVSPEKAATDIIQKALVEKELLLKELNHRVKNNLQTVASMLSIQSRQVDDPEMRDMLLANRSRIQAISLVHKELYGEDFDGHLNLGSTLRTISEGIVSLGDGAAQHIDVVFTGVSVRFSIDRAVPLGLVVGELVSNVCKHAFPEWAEIDTPRVTIKLAKTDTMIILEVYDNGVGVDHPRRTKAKPTSKNPSSDAYEINTISMGNQLIKGFVSQLDGSISQDTPFPEAVNGYVGTRYIVQVPKQDSVIE